MVKYLADIEAGRLSREENEAVRTENGHEIWLVNPEEFNLLRLEPPYKKSLVRALEQIQYCKIEMFRDGVQGTMKVPKGNADKIMLLTFGFYIKENKLIFIEEGTMIENMLEKISGNLSGNCTLNQILFILFEMLIEDDVIYLQSLEECLAVMEEELLREIPGHFYETILQYRKKFTLFHSYYEQLIDIGDRMQEYADRDMTGEEASAWQNYANRAERLHNHVEALREYLIQIRELYQSQIDIRQNKVMSILTVVTTFFLPLTLLVGWYGMNFPNMPEFGWKYGYQFVIVVCLIIILAEIIYFKKKKLL